MDAVLKGLRDENKYLYM